MADWVVFWIAGPLSVAAAAMMLLSRNAVHAALWLIVNLFTLAVFFLVLGSPFLFVVQIIVYAGAIMVLFLFVIMLLGVDRDVPLTEPIRGQRWIALVLGAALVGAVVFAIRVGVGFAAGELPDFEAVNAGGNIQALGRALFGPYFLAFEATAVLLIVAAIGAMLHGRRRFGEDETVDADTEAEAPNGVRAGRVEAGP